jgi:hypothetical protein
VSSILLHLGMRRIPWQLSVWMEGIDMNERSLFQCYTLLDFNLIAIFSLI